MNVEAFLICDAATDSHGKLNVLGAFDTVYVAQLPAVHPHCAVVVRLRFERSEQGEHAITLHLIDADGKHVIQPLEGRLRVHGGASSTATSNLILNMQGLRLEKYGELAFHLAIDGQPSGNLPLHVLAPAGAAPPPPAPPVGHG